MKSILCLAAATLVAPLTAQAPTEFNQLGISFGQPVSFLTRGNIPIATAGDCLALLPAEHFVNLGSESGMGLGRLDGISVALRDDDGATTANIFDFTVYGSDAMGNLDLTQNPVRLPATLPPPLSTDPNFPVVAGFFTLSLTTPVTFDKDENLWVGCGLDSTASVNDITFMFDSSHVVGGGGAGEWDEPGPGFDPINDNYEWSMDELQGGGFGALGALTINSSNFPAAPFVEIFLAGPSLVPAAVTNQTSLPPFAGQSPGVTGYGTALTPAINDPATGRVDDPGIVLIEGRAVGGAAFLFASPTTSTLPAPLPLSSLVAGGRNLVCVDLPSLLQPDPIVIIDSDADGLFEFTLPLGPAGSPARTLLTTTLSQFVVQAVVLAPVGVIGSNCAIVKTQ